VIIDLSKMSMTESTVLTRWLSFENVSYWAYHESTKCACRIEQLLSASIIEIMNILVRKLQALQYPNISSFEITSECHRDRSHLAHLLFHHHLSAVHKHSPSLFTNVHYHSHCHNLFHIT
jgi:hypothetical protein